MKTFRGIIQDEIGVEMNEDAEVRGMEVLDLFLLLYGSKELNDSWAQEYRLDTPGLTFDGYGFLSRPRL